MLVRTLKNIKFVTHAIQSLQEGLLYVQFAEPTDLIQKK